MHRGGLVGTREPTVLLPSGKPLGKACDIILVLTQPAEDEILTLAKEQRNLPNCILSWKLGKQ